MSGAPGRQGVIHDIGYRSYGGPRVGTGGIARSLLWSGVLAVFGFGRSGKAKILPFALLAMSIVPAVVLVGIMAFIGLGPELLNYAGYTQNTAFLVALFVAAQAPVLFSRDLRSGVISLYLARPLGAAQFALLRWSSLLLSILAFVVTPLLILVVGGLAAGADPGEELPKVAVAIGGAVLLAVVLATVAALAASWTMRRGLAVGGTIMVLLMGLGITAALQEVASGEGQDRLATWLGLLSPFVVVDSVQVGLSDAAAVYPAPAGTAGTALLMLAVALALVVLGLGALVCRYRSKGS
ncbi:hypothetical protein ACQE98_14080 [Ornithinimicrobium sp. W1679]|uniref:hypothetical protein n=1 Tax=Ornithinimicrobium sp. W1679 TaxID=3418770 RepID=UPI003CF72EE7